MEGGIYLPKGGVAGVHQILEAGVKVVEEIGDEPVRDAVRVGIDQSGGFRSGGGRGFRRWCGRGRLVD